MRVTAKQITRRQALDCLHYRTPMRIREVYIHSDGTGYYVCPRCRLTLDREFSAYCDRCGQCLNWSQYKHARRIF